MLSIQHTRVVHIDNCRESQEHLDLRLAPPEKGSDALLFLGAAIPLPRVSGNLILLIATRNIMGEKLRIITWL